MQQNVKDNALMEGLITVRTHAAGTVRMLRILNAFGQRKLANAIVSTGKVAAQNHNTIMKSDSRGIDLLIQWLVSGLNRSVAYPIGPQWGEIGTGTTAPTEADTALVTPKYRAPLSSASDVGFGQAQLQFYFSDSDLAADTYTEFGTYVSTKSTLGDGQLFNRGLFTTSFTKTSGYDTTVEVDISIANA